MATGAGFVADVDHPVWRIAVRALLPLILSGRQESIDGGDAYRLNAGPVELFGHGRPAIRAMVEVNDENRRYSPVPASVRSNQAGAKLLQTLLRIRKGSRLFAKLGGQTRACIRCSIWWAT